MKVFRLIALVVVVVGFSTRVAADDHGSPEKSAMTAVSKYMECIKASDDTCMKKWQDKMADFGEHSCRYLSAEFAEAAMPTQVVLVQSMVQLNCLELNDVVSEVLLDRANESRAEFALELARTGQPSLFEPIAMLVKKGKPYEKEKGCEALAILGVPEAVSVIVEASKHSMFSVRQEAAEALAHFATDESILRLCDLLEEDLNSGVRATAATSLAALKDSRAVPCLIKALSSQSNALITAAHGALVAISGADLGISPDAWQSWWEKSQAEN